MTLDQNAAFKQAIRMKHHNIVKAMLLSALADAYPFPTIPVGVPFTEKDLSCFGQGRYNVVGTDGITRKGGHMDHLVVGVTEPRYGWDLGIIGTSDTASNLKGQVILVPQGLVLCDREKWYFTDRSNPGSDLCKPPVWATRREYPQIYLGFGQKALDILLAQKVEG